MDDLLSARPPTNISVELTSKCNLRCRYCSMDAAKDVYKQQVMPEKLVGRAIDLIKNSLVGLLCLSGRGEITTIKNWERLLGRFKGLGLRRHLVSNLSVSLSWEQACTLARMDSLAFSIDSTDPDLTRKIRKGCDLEKLIANVNLIKAAARHQGLARPSLSVISVATVASIHGLSRVAALAIELGVSSFSLQDLVFYYDEPDADVDSRHISVLPPDRLDAARREIMTTIDMLKAAGVAFQTYSPLVDFLNGGTLVSVGMISHLGRHRRTSTPVPEGYTRDCRMPWEMAVLLADGGVEPCCGGIGPLGRFTDIASLAEIPKLPGVRALRQALLTGALPNECRFCSLTAAVPIAEFRKNIAQFVAEFPAPPAA